MPEYFKPSVTADVMVLRPGAQGLELLLIQRAHAPFAGSWALPGGFIEADEQLIDSARRELHEETGLQLQELYFFGVYGAPGRDPRGRTITVAYSALLEADAAADAKGLDDAADARWFDCQQLPVLAFDHAQIIAEGLENLRCRLANTYPLQPPLTLSPALQQQLANWLRR